MSRIDWPSTALRTRFAHRLMTRFDQTSSRFTRQPSAASWPGRASQRAARSAGSFWRSASSVATHSPAPRGTPRPSPPTAPRSPPAGPAAARGTRRPAAASTSGVASVEPSSTTTISNPSSRMPGRPPPDQRPERPRRSRRPAAAGSPPRPWPARPPTGRPPPRRSRSTRRTMPARPAEAGPVRRSCRIDDMDRPPCLDRQPSRRTVPGPTPRIFHDNRPASSPSQPDRRTPRSWTDPPTTVLLACRPHWTGPEPHPGRRGQGRPGHDRHPDPAAADPRDRRPRDLSPNPFSIAIYGDPDAEIGDLIESVRAHGILVPLVVAPRRDDGWEVVSGHRRLACARALGLAEVPCEVRDVRRPGRPPARRPRIQPPAPQDVQPADARGRRPRSPPRGRRPAGRRRANLRQFQDDVRRCRASEFRRSGRSHRRRASPRPSGSAARTSTARPAPSGGSPGPATPAPERRRPARRRDQDRPRRLQGPPPPRPLHRRLPPHPLRRLGVQARPRLRHPPPRLDPARRSSPTRSTTTPTPGALVVDPMAGGGTTLDVCESMGRRCLAYDLHPVRPDIHQHDVNDGFPPEASGCDLSSATRPIIPCSPAATPTTASPTSRSPPGSPSSNASPATAFAALRPGGHVALLLANQTEKDLPAGHGYLDHAFLGYKALIAAGFLPERRISCPMDGAYLPQHVRRARPTAGCSARSATCSSCESPGRRHGLRAAARRRPARRPCPGRTGWRGSGCAGRSARAASATACRTRSSSSSGRRLSITRLIAASSSASRRLLLPGLLPLRVDRA